MENEEEPPRRAAQFQCETGGDLLSQGESAQVPSAQLDLTSVFEMGTGVTPALSLPRLLHQILSDLRPDEPCQTQLGRVRSLMSIQLSIKTDSTESATGLDVSQIQTEILSEDSIASTNTHLECSK